MSISFTRYVDITSGVIGNAPVRVRQLITRIFSTNPLIPSNSFAEFSNETDVGDYFGTQSEEFLRAQFYFSFVSKTTQSPQLISFSSWVETAVPANIFGDPLQTATLATFQTITSGGLNLTLGEETTLVSAVNLSAATSLANVAALMQTAIRTQNTSDPNWSAALVTFNASSGSFSLTGGVASPTGPVPVAVSAVPSGTDIGVSLGWESANTIFSFGSQAMTLTETMNASQAASNNFASFCFTVESSLNLAQIEELATWNAGQNFAYIGEYRVKSSTAVATSNGIFGFAGNSLTLAPLTLEFPEMVPGIVLAATDYTKQSASQNYMFQQFPSLTPSVTDDADENTFDPLRVNYIGQTQSAGQNISFYQRGTLMGGNTAATDMNVYANEIWFKSQAAAALMTMLLAYNEVPNTPAGRTIVISNLQPVIAQALLNGTISPGQTLTAAQKGVIAAVTGSTTSYLQIQSIGYWLDVEFSSSITSDGRTEFAATYTLLYTKNNAIRSVVGTHSLI